MHRHFLVLRQERTLTIICTWRLSACPFPTSDSLLNWQDIQQRGSQPEQALALQRRALGRALTLMMVLLRMFPQPQPLRGRASNTPIKHQTTATASPRGADSL